MNHILITGATGALGSELIPRFLKDPSTCVTILLRAASAEELGVRREKLLSYLGLAPNSDISSRLEAVLGDTSQPGLGLDEAQLHRLAESLTHIVHSAGNVKLNQPIDQARKTAVEATEYIVDLTQRCSQAGQFKKLEFVSTVGVAGRRSGLIPEVRFAGPRESTEFHNTYEASKWQAEQFLWEQIDQGLPATIHRPSMIVGDSQHGRIIHYQVFYFLTDFLIGRKTGGIVPETSGSTLDIIPVDYVADAICKAATEQLGLGQVWHLCSGPHGAWQLDKLVLHIREMLETRGQKLPDLRSEDRQRFRLTLEELTAKADEREKRFLMGLPYLLDYLESQQQFDNALTDKLLAQSGLNIPPVGSYIETIMDKYWNRYNQSKV